MFSHLQKLSLLAGNKVMIGVEIQRRTSVPNYLLMCMIKILKVAGRHRREGDEGVRDGLGRPPEPWES